MTGRIGATLPVGYVVPTFHTNLGEDAIQLAHHAGLHLDEWQQNVLVASLGYGLDGKFTAPDVVLIVPRQNGKGSILEARELAGLFLLKERVIMHSAHEHKTAKEAHKRLKALIENTPDLMEETEIFRNSGADTSIELKKEDGEDFGRRVLFVARSGGSGRGFTVDTVILDEAYNLGDTALDAMSPMQTAVRNPQMWFVSSTGMDDSEVLKRMSDAGKARTPEIAYFEWKADDGCNSSDRDQWYKANPALGIRVEEKFLQKQHTKLSTDGFAREHLGLWASNSIGSLITSAMWTPLKWEQQQIDAGLHKIVDKASFALDIDPDSTRACIYASGLNVDGLHTVEKVAWDEGVLWVPDFLKSLQDKQKAEKKLKSIAIDFSGPAGALRPAFDALGLEYSEMTAAHVSAACAAFLNRVVDQSLRHWGPHDTRLTDAVGQGIKRLIGVKGAWAWAPKDISSDITPLVAATNALYAFEAFEGEPERDGGFW